MRFTKGHGTANDFVVVPDPDGELTLSDAQVRALCDRRTGVGGDGVLRMVLTAAMPGYAERAGEARWFMDYRNADGSAVEMCGNGVRVFARYLVDRGYAPPGPLRVATRDGVKDVELLADGDVRVDMGPARDVTDLPAGGVFVSMGNPHVVLFEDDLAAAPVATVGAALDAEWLGGTNVEFVRVAAADAVAMRVWERGVGETASCGTGACASVVAAAHRGLTGVEAAVTVPGGRLRVRVGETVLLTGPAVLVADGEVRDDWLKGADA